MKIQKKQFSLQNEVSNLSDSKMVDQRKMSSLRRMDCKGFSAIFILLIASLTACDSKVKLAGKSEEKVQQGVDAQKRLEELDRVAEQHEKLELELQEMVKRGGLQDSLRDSIAIDFIGFQKKSTGMRSLSEDCMSILSVPGRMSSKEFPDFFRYTFDPMKETAPCPTIVISVDRFDVLQGYDIKTQGRNLIIMADFVALNGKIDTTPAPGSNSESGNKGGDLKIYTLKLERGPLSEINTSGSDAGEVVLPKGALSSAQIKSIRAEAARHIRYADKKGNTWATDSSKLIKMAPKVVLASQHAGIEQAYSRIQSEARSFITKRHPSYRGDAPDPFAGGRGAARPVGVDYFWQVRVENLTQLVDAHSFVVKVPFTDNRVGGAPGKLEIYAADPLTEIVDFNFTTEIGDVPLSKHNSAQKVEATKVNAPLKVKLQKKINYTFRLMQKASGAEYDTAKHVKSWTESVMQKSKEQEIKARVDLVMATPSSESPVAVPEPIVPVLESGSTQIYDLVLNTLRGEPEFHLGDGIRKFKDWSEDWNQLQDRAKKINYLIQRPTIAK
jgi:hypothetical protein